MANATEKIVMTDSVKIQIIKLDKKVNVKQEEKKQ